MILFPDALATHEEYLEVFGPAIVQLCRTVVLAGGSRSRTQAPIQHTIPRSHLARELAARSGEAARTDGAAQSERGSARARIDAWYRRAETLEAAAGRVTLQSVEARRHGARLARRARLKTKSATAAHTAIRSRMPHDRISIAQPVGELATKSSRPIVCDPPNVWRPIASTRRPWGGSKC